MRASSPHIRDYTGPRRDYNGTGQWTVEAIQGRYRAHATALGSLAAELNPYIHSEGECTWVFPLMAKIIKLMENGDPAAMEIGIEFLHEEPLFAFGRILKSNTARALRRAQLTEPQQQTLRIRLIEVLLGGQASNEWKEYKKLLRRIGIAELWPMLDLRIDRSDDRSMRRFGYLKLYVR